MVSTSSRPGMGANVHAGGVTFRVWAPFARTVAVAGDFNGWSGSASPLAAEGGGYWSADVPGAAEGSRYKFVLDGLAGVLWRKDPYAREVSNSSGDSIVRTEDFDWAGAAYRMPPWNELVIYELHVGTFNDDSRDGTGGSGDEPGGFDSVIARLDHLVDLGVNAIELMPSMEFATSFSWGYNPSDIFAIESAYGGPTALKALVRAAHERGVAVLFDVVYNHFGPSDLDLWRFDGWSADDGGGIYFYQDGRRQTPWGATRPDYGRPEVRAYIADNARRWLEEFRFDGLRWDATAFIRNVYGGGDPAHDIPAGWGLMRQITGDTDARQPWKLHIAEDLHSDERLTRPATAGGAGFDSQWDAAFVHPVRAVLAAASDEGRNMADLRDAILHRYGSDPLARVIYTESHDEVANGHRRLPEEITPGEAGSWYARKRSTLGAVLVLTSPGIPMIFQGQEILEDEWFRDKVPIDWSRGTTYAGVLALYRDLIRLRRNLEDTTRGLRGGGVDVHHVDDDANVLGYRRWDAGGPGDDVVVALNVSWREHASYRFGVPRGGDWVVRVDTDRRRYGTDYGGGGPGSVPADDQPWDGLPHSIAVPLRPYTALVISQDR